MNDIGRISDSSELAPIPNKEHAMLLERLEEMVTKNRRESSDSFSQESEDLTKHTQGKARKTIAVRNSRSRTDRDSLTELPNLLYRSNTDVK